MNGEVFDGSQTTFPKLLRQAGYTTALIGKWHLHGLPQGFDYWKILNDQGNYYNPHFIQLGDTAGIDRAYVDQTPHWALNMADTAIVEGYATDLITDEALAYLDQVKDSTTPFMVMIHHKAPHRNWMPALRHLNLYDSVSFPLPDSYFSTHEGQLAAQQQQQTIYVDMYEGHDLKMTVAKGSSELAHNPWKTDFERMTPAQRAAWDKAYQAKNDAMHEANLTGRELAIWKGQRYLQDYLATVAAVDEGVGRILDYLQQNGLADNTLLVYTSDQGFYLGEKGWFDKRFMYEESLRMPLLMMYPAGIKRGSVVEALTQNLDFAPTFLDYARVPIPQNMQGQSLRPLLETSSSPDAFRQAIYYHYYDYPAFHMVKKQYGVRTSRYKLIHFYDDIDAWELYDLEKDPHELTNLINAPAYQPIRQKLLLTLDSLQQAYGVTEKEFERASREAIEQQQENFRKLRGPKPDFHH
ncbi:sulfatase/phosphatase domain-containing protein [Cesiribacter andamanensis]